MPFDKNKRFHLNTQRAMGADKTPPPKSPNMHKQSGMVAEGVADPHEDAEMGDSTRTIINHNDDGSHSVMHHDGEETGPHDSIEEALDAIHAKHGGGEEMPPHHGGKPMHGMPMHEHALSGM